MALHHEIHYITDSEEQKTATHNNARAKRGRLCDSKISKSLVFLYSFTLYNLVRSGHFEEYNRLFPCFKNLR